jgi:hypothetical protein
MQAHRPEAETMLDPKNRIGVSPMREPRVGADA